MFKVTVSFYPKAHHKPEAINAMWAQCASWYQGGVLCEPYGLSLPGKNVVHLAGLAYEKVAFTPANETAWIRKDRLELRPFLRRTPTFAWERLLESFKVCACPKKRELVFAPSVEPFPQGTPLACLHCGGRVPLYRFNSRTKYGHRVLLNTAKQRRWFHGMWMDSGRTEALGWFQIADPRSDLARMARETLGEFEKRHRVRMYYEIYKHYLKGRRAPLCSNCGRSWEPVLNINHGLICRACRLFTLEPANRDLPSWWRPLPYHR